MLHGPRMRSVGMHARMAPARARIASGAVNGNFGGGQRRAEAVAQRFLAAMGTQPPRAHARWRRLALELRRVGEWASVGGRAWR